MPGKPRGFALRRRRECMTRGSVHCCVRKRGDPLRGEPCRAARSALEPPSRRATRIDRAPQLWYKAELLRLRETAVAPAPVTVKACRQRPAPTRLRAALLRVLRLLQDRGGHPNRVRAVYPLLDLCACLECAQARMRAGRQLKPPIVNSIQPAETAANALVCSIEQGVRPCRDVPGRERLCYATCPWTPGLTG
jgi:hypothetical protein